MTVSPYSYNVSKQMKMAISGKGGVGKTTVAGTLCRMLGRRGRSVLAIDGDPNPNLSVVLGIARHETPPLSTKLVERVEENGETRVQLSAPLDEVLTTYGIEAPDNVTLLMVGKPDHAGSGCMCGSHAVVREVVHAAVAEADDRVTVLDMEASLEHMKRGTAKYVDALYIIVEPYYRSLEAASRIQSLAQELGIQKIAAVGNKVRSDEDEEAIRAFCERSNLDLVSIIPFDESIIQAERERKAFIEADGQAQALQRISELADSMLAG